MKITIDNVSYEYDSSYDLQDFVRNNVELEDKPIYEILKLMIECYRTMLLENYLPEEL